MSEIERLNMIAEWQEQHKQLIEDLDNSKKRIEELERKLEQTEKDLTDYQFNYPKIKELEKEKCELLGIIQGKDKVIKDLEWQLHEVAKDNDEYQKENARLTTNEKTLLAERKIIVKENAELKKEYRGNLSLKDEELMCLETEFNTYKSEAKEIIKQLLLLPYANNKEVYSDITSVLDKAEQFLKE